ncbi:MAG TPA: FlgD immunoglobulin-like domain containing protein, partial [Steroidobacteraceae bacterium]|nr:FlgD immunoglobulin-like domain containing protein [Steroidobacteraceae bacterium]
NSFTWNGMTASGSTAPDGAYNVAVAGTTSSGSTGTLPFTVVGTVTGVNASGSNVMIDLGQLQVNMSAVTSVNN